MRGLMELAPLGNPRQGRGNRRRDALRRSARRRSDWAGAAQLGHAPPAVAIAAQGLQTSPAPDPLVAAEMALLRLIHAADLPDPAALWRD